MSTVSDKIEVEVKADDDGVIVNAETQPDENGELSTKAEPESKEDKLQSRIDELEDRLLRSAAEFENYKKRVARQFESQAEFATDNLLLELLEVVDNLDRALEHSGDNSDHDSLRKGSEMIRSQLLALLNKYDVAPIEALGEPFDPNLHEALMQIESEEYPVGRVAMETTRGYKRGDRVLRHSKVAVSQAGSKDVKESDA